MNLIVVRGGYPGHGALGGSGRNIGALQEAQAGSGESTIPTVLYERLDATLDDYLQVLADPQSAPA